MRKREFAMCLLGAGLTVGLWACGESKLAAPAEAYQCQTAPQNATFTQNGLIRTFDPVIIERLGQANLPDAQGAQGRNQAAYFHVRFQTGISPLADYAVARENLTALDQAVRATEYSFAHQRPAGDFTLVIPSSLATQPPPTAADVTSGVAFFLASAGPALLAFDESDWYRNAAATASCRARVAALRPAVQRAAAWLVQQQSTLAAYDSLAPNRLYFDAVAYYSLGRYLNDEPTRQVGLRFARQAIRAQHGRGYYQEGGGYDSSYQGVGLALGFRLLTLLPATEPLRADLWNSLSCGTNWQASRVLASGEISTQGNTRVYPGGEAFLGTEKQVAWTSTMLACWDMYYFTGLDQYRELATRLIAHYS
ncbi:hypothetical protein IC235_13315 [Hymenobacter sp. BT664]|uniref:Uncharacterized protein n=1 Tax=Hymenobacter montanus TaxID=2771359 RepID=A0A927GJU2_9BACT|nr:hypothetical protein [Hymenobacter montanus]MBD2768867.1 hypothetical protein [Hymenobacter montanus]